MHNLWSNEMNKTLHDSEPSGVNVYFELNILGTHNGTEKVRAKAREMLGDYIDNMPHWLLMGHTPQEAGVLLSGYKKQGLIRKNTSIKENDSYLDMVMPTQPYVSQKTPRPNDLCPCGSEKKHKKCCGK